MTHKEHEHFVELQNEIEELKQQNTELLEAAIEVVKQHSTDPKSIHHKIWELQRVINKYTQL